MRKREEWRELGWGPYIVSSEGRIARIKRPWTGPHGYVRAQSVRHDGAKVPTYAHQLVAEAFIGPKPDGCEIHHRDGDKTNNRATNLEYVTRRENMVLGSALGQVAKGEKHWKSKLTAERVKEIRRRYADGGVSQAALAAEYGIHQTVVGGIVRRESWRHIE